MIGMDGSSRRDARLELGQFEVVLSSLDGISQYFVGFGQLLKLVGRLRLGVVWVSIGMMDESLSFVSSFDLFRVGILIDSE